MTSAEFSHLRRGSVVEWLADQAIGLVCHIARSEGLPRVWVRWENGDAEGYTDLDARRIRKFTPHES